MKNQVIFCFSILISIFSIITGCSKEPIGTLKVSEKNPHYFIDKKGKAVYLTGSHTWNNLVDMNPRGQSEPFDYNRYIGFLKSYNHNFIRLWKWDLLVVNGENGDDQHIHEVDLHPWPRVGPGEALDGKLKFDLTQFNQEYFDRLRNRAELAAKENIYVAVMLFEGWGLQFIADAYRNHPFHPGNNVNGIDPDTAQNASGFAIYELKNERVTRLQEQYVQKVIETVGHLDNILYEISNENHLSSTEWQYHMIRYIKELQMKNGKMHPVGMTFQYKGGSNQDLFNSPADWISPNHEGGYREDPPENTRGKVIISDTDHLWGIGGNRQWVWKSFLRGLNPIFMDPYYHRLFEKQYNPDWEDVRKSMGYTRQFAEKMDLVMMVPDRVLSSSGYCLSNKGKEYLFYFPEAKEEPMEVDLSMEKGTYNMEWFNPATGEYRAGSTVKAGEKIRLQSPFESKDAVVYIKRK
jgi:hypothetical protein